MSEERLSRLQKWILKALYILGSEYRIRVKDLRNRSVWPRAELRDLPSPWRERKSSEASMKVSFSRAIYSLIYKELLFEFGCESNPVIDFYQVNSIRRRPVKSVGLTEEGKVKAQEFLNVKKSKINNKTHAQTRVGGLT